MEASLFADIRYDQFDLNDDEVQQLLLDADNRMKSGSSVPDGSSMTLRSIDSQRSRQVLPRYGLLRLPFCVYEG